MFSEISSTVTQGIRVNVRSAYVSEESSVRHQHYVFAYQVEIINESDRPVKLLRRKWFITDAFGQKRVVSGEGVIGKQPVIRPGETHRYVSGCNFVTPEGKMEGYYTMINTRDHSEFNVRIPPFTMVLPTLLN